MPTPYLPLKIASLFWFATSVAAMVVGAGLLGTPLFLVGIALSLFGLVQAVRQFDRLLRISAAEQLLRRSGRPHGPFVRANLPRQVFLLLYSLAEVDGRAGPQERELVRQFVLARFVDPAVHADLLSWDVAPVAGADLMTLVHDLRVQLSPAEVETLFTWCCLVALVDRRFNESEHAFLREVSLHLGLAPEHARRLFLYAKQHILAADAAGERGGTRREPAPSPRARALEILGLGPGATADDVRRRHRELVKRYHPDTHRHLGEVAAAEAVERFHQVQRAYETLTAG